MTHSATDQLFEYWKSRTRFAAIPDRVDMVPSELDPKLLPHIFLLELNPDGSVLFRLAGTDICLVHNRELVRTKFRNLWSFTDLPLIDTELTRVFRDQLVVQIGSHITFQRGLCEFQTLILPLRHGSEGCTRAIGCMAPQSPPAAMLWKGEYDVSRHSVLTITEKAWKASAVIKDPRLQPPAHEVPVFELSRRGRPPENGRKVGHLTVIEGGAI